ncbi:hypothetical protein [Micromonospora echinospora]|uniref:hypothetical protein n=1 Tax=Micromonospora echinospora TaxID=1877 RepID=UPI003A887886
MSNLGNHLSGSGYRDEALAAAEEAVGIYRRLAEANPTAHLPHLATSLWAHASASVNVKANLPQALETVSEAIDIYQPLVKQLPQMFGSQLVLAYRTLADVLEALGRKDEADVLRQQLKEISGGTRE